MIFNRRNFIKSSSALVAGMAVSPWAKTFAGQVAPSDMIRVGLIGCKNRGNRVLGYFMSNPGVYCAAVCDVEREYLTKAAAGVAKRQGKAPDMYTDYRELLDRKDIDVVIIGTPDHWHCLQFVDACKAGKDIYVEKPIANSIAECDIMVAATHKYNRIVQVGQQQRSGKHWREMVEYLKSGELGTVGRVHVWANFNYGSMAPPVPDSAVPEGVDFESWLGPAPKIAYNRQRHRSWRMFWNYGGGLMTDWGVHLIDMALWGMDVKTLPVKTLASGGNFMLPTGAQETLDTMSVTYLFNNFVIEWENNGGVETGPYGKRYGLFFKGTNGTLVADRLDWEVYPEKEKVPVKKVLSDDRDKDDHVTSFLENVRTRNHQTACPIENGSLCAKYAHLGNIGARLGGANLIYDDQAGKFNIDEANRFIKPEYRSPYVFPEL